jgi:S-DNA-T family DNA segregation ATPase FtsK/SpoIIIE
MPQSLTFEDFYSAGGKAGELVFGIGWGRIGRVWVDLTEVPHMLVGGTPGSGKSVFLRQVLVRLALTYSPSMVNLLLVDLKGGMEFYPFRELPHLWAPVVSDVPELGPVLTRLVAELDRRQSLFRAEGVVSLRHWNERRPAERLPYIVVIVDEFGELTRPVAESSTDGSRGRSPKASAHTAFSTVARLGRALGIHLIVCTQRPDADVMPGQIKAQLPATVAFRTRGETNSHILLGDRDPAAALLPAVKGRAVFQWETEDEVQAPFISPEAALALLWEKYGQPVGHGRVTQCPTCPDEMDGEVAA